MVKRLLLTVARRSVRADRGIGIMELAKEGRMWSVTASGPFRATSLQLQRGRSGGRCSGLIPPLGLLAVGFYQLQLIT